MSAARNLGPETMSARDTPAEYLVRTLPYGLSPMLQPGHHQEGPDEDGQEDQNHRDWARTSDS